MLVTDAHGGFGGIAQYNQDVLEALSISDRIKEVVVLPRIVGETSFQPPSGITYDLKSAGGRTRFVVRCIRQAAKSGRFDLIYCAHINLLPLASLLAHWLNVPLLLAIYGIDAWKAPGRLAAKLAKQPPDLVMSISEITLKRFQTWSNIDEKRTAISPNAIRTHLYGAGPKNNDLISKHNLVDRKVIMTLGRMSPEERYKGFDEILEALPLLRTRIPELTYLAVGDGGDRKRLEAKARKLGVSDIVVFTGRIPDAQKADYYRVADAYVMPSSGEGFGFVVIEALACGIPVVASTTDGTREALRNGALGQIVEPSNAVDLKNAIFNALNQPKGVPEGLDYFSFEKFATRIEEAVHRAIDARAQAAA